VPQKLEFPVPRALKRLTQLLKTPNLALGVTPTLDKFSSMDLRKRKTHSVTLAITLTGWVHFLNTSPALSTRCGDSDLEEFTEGLSMENQHQAGDSPPLGLQGQGKQILTSYSNQHVWHIIGT
jgi:hypothetical protein